MLLQQGLVSHHDIRQRYRHSKVLFRQLVQRFRDLVYVFSWIQDWVNDGGRIRLRAMSCCHVLLSAPEFSTVFKVSTVFNGLMHYPSRVSKNVQVKWCSQCIYSCLDGIVKQDKVPLFAHDSRRVPLEVKVWSIRSRGIVQTVCPGNVVRDVAHDVLV